MPRPPELAFSRLVLHKFILCPLSVLRSWGESRCAAHPQGYAAPLGGHTQIQVVWNSEWVLTHSPTFTSLFHRLYVSLQTRDYLFHNLGDNPIRLYAFAPVGPALVTGALLADSSVPLVPHHVGGGALPYFLELQGVPASSGAAPASALESDGSPGILVAPVGEGTRHVIWC